MMNKRTSRFSMEAVHMTPDQMRVLLSVLDDAATLLEWLPTQPTDALTDSVHRCSCDLRKAYAAVEMHIISAELDTLAVRCVAIGEG